MIPADYFQSWQRGIRRGGGDLDLQLHQVLFREDEGGAESMLAFHRPIGYNPNFIIPKGAEQEAADLGAPAWEGEERVHDGRQVFDPPRAFRDVPCARAHFAGCGHDPLVNSMTLGVPDAGGQPERDYLGWPAPGLRGRPVRR